MGIFEPVFSVRNYFRIAAFMFVLVLVFLLSWTSIYPGGGPYETDGDA